MLMIHLGERFTLFDEGNVVSDEGAKLLGNLKKNDKSVVSKEVEHLDKLIDEFLELNDSKEDIIDNNNVRTNYNSHIDRPIHDEDYDLTNHKLKLENMKKKLKNDFTLGVLKSNVDYILGTMENVDNLYSK